MSEDSFFTPSHETVEQYRKQVKSSLESNNKKFEVIDMGELPVVYAALGIADKRLKTNGKTLLKALGVEGRNKHSVPMETIENLLSLTYDPEAVFKSLTKSGNPDAYIAVLQAKTKNDELIIAILSPSRDGQGFTFIPSVYEKHNFQRFLEKTHEEEKILYIKSKGSELWGQLQLLPRHNPKPSMKSIQTKEDIVKLYYNQVSNPVRMSGDNIVKGKSMANEFEHDDEEMENDKTQDPRKRALYHAVDQQKAVSDALKNGTLCCLPGADGYADTQPAKNLLSDRIYHGATQLAVKAHQIEGGFPTGEYITYDLYTKMKETNPDLIIRKGQNGVTINYSERNDAADKYEEKFARLLNVAQFNKPDKVKELIEQNKQEKHEEYIADQKRQYGSKWQPSEKKEQEAGAEIVCSSTEPAKYLGQYLAAISTNGKFKVSPEQAKEFSEKLDAVLSAPHISKETGQPLCNKEGIPYPGAFNLSNLSREANKECVAFKTQMRMEAQKLNQPEQKLEQSRGRGM
jgi:hypothetical protein